MIFVVATIEIAEGKRDAFLHEFHRVMPAVLKEEGCIEYGPAIDVDTLIPAQDDPRPNVVVVMEKWESIEALEDHLIASHMIEYRERVKELVNNVNLQVLEPAADPQG